ncbi:hypothetical protein KM043_006099 [Ampulex compressa]|nr:hypothetical protein KM043_006099 [Ampulex compressa]
MTVFERHRIEEQKPSSPALGRRQSSGMSIEEWNNDAAYAFSIQRMETWIYGTWPLQGDDIFALVRWSAIVFAEENIESAIDDWLSDGMQDGARKVMKSYARTSRIFTQIILIMESASVVLYLFGVAILKRRQMISMNFNVSDVNGTAKEFPLMPMNWVNDDITETYYSFIFVVQLIQGIAIAMGQCVTDSFFFTIVMHLSGQLEVLKMEFKNFGAKKKTVTGHEKQLCVLIKRHCRLMKLAGNLQDTFSVIIFLQLGLGALIVAIASLRLVISIRHRDQSELAKSVVLIVFISVESLIYIHAGDLLLTRSEGIFRAVFEAPWYNLTPKITKDLTFIMMAAKNPLRLNGAGFFYVSRTTLTYILNTAVSYVSVLQMAIRN